MTLEFLVRPEQPGDEGEIWHLTKRAFADRPYADGNEQDIVDSLRNNGVLPISLVAVRHAQIIGHVAFSPAVPKDSSPGWYTLGPVSVEPDVQRQGVGKGLIRDGIDRLQRLNAAGCIVLGDTNYYSQFGFVPAPHNAPAGVPAQHFMVLSMDGRTPTCAIDFHEVFYGNVR